MRKLTFIAGLAIGYVLGTRAGRERYEQLSKAAHDLAATPGVQSATRNAKQAAGSAAGKAADAVVGAGSRSCRAGPVRARPSPGRLPWLRRPEPVRPGPAPGRPDYGLAEHPPGCANV